MCTPRGPKIEEMILPEGPIAHFSYWQLNTYLACPRRHPFQYVQIIPPAFTSAALVFGSAVHEAAAAYYQLRFQGDELLPDQMADVYRQAWQEAENVNFFNGAGEESLFKEAKQLIEVVLRETNPAPGDPVAFQRFLSHARTDGLVIRF